MQEKFDIIVKTQSGLEDILVGELEQIGAQNIEKIKRGAKCTGDKELLYKANYLCRTAMKVLKPIKDFTITSQQDLYDQIKLINWRDFLNLHHTFAIHHAVNSTIFSHSQYAAYRVKDAIADQFNDKYGERPNVDVENPDLQLHLYINEDKCSIALDSSGDSLHKRGYRTEPTHAPINEVLAAGLIMLSEWDANSPFIDPMCGSGTILIEAGMIAANIPPGSYRKKFAFENWPDFDYNLWLRIKDQASKKIKKKITCPIIGCEIDVDTALIARDNVDEARLSRFVDVQLEDFNDFKHTFESGTLISNPPYNERIKLANEDDFYKNIGDNFKQSYQGFTAWIITSNMDALKSVGLKTKRKIPVFNGSLECRFVKYELYEGSKKEDKE